MFSITTKSNTTLSGKCSIKPLYDGLNGPVQNVVCFDVEATETKSEKGRHYLLVMDVSGSMQTRLEEIKSCLKDLFSVRAETIAKIQDSGIVEYLPLMGESDDLAIVAFNDCAWEVLPRTKITEESEEVIFEAIDSMKAGGGTKIAKGLNLATRELDNDVPTYLIFITDGEDDEFESMNPTAIKSCNMCMPVIIGIGDGTDIESLVSFHKKVEKGSIRCLSDKKIRAFIKALCKATRDLLTSPLELEYSVNFVDVEPASKRRHNTTSVRIALSNDETLSVPIEIKVPEGFYGTATVTASLILKHPEDTVLFTDTLKLASWNTGELRLECIKAACNCYMADVSERIVCNRTDSAQEIETGTRALTALQAAVEEQAGITLVDGPIIEAIERLSVMASEACPYALAARTSSDSRAGNCSFSSQIDMD